MKTKINQGSGLKLNSYDDLFGETKDTDIQELYLSELYDFEYKQSFADRTGLSNGINTAFSRFVSCPVSGICLMLMAKGDGNRWIRSG